MRFAITMLTHRNNPVMLKTLTELIKWTTFPEDTHFYILVQCCSKDYISTIKSFTSGDYFPKQLKIFITEDSPGLSHANNFLYEQTKDYQFVFHLEDDWILTPPVHKSWLNISLKRMENHPDLSTIAFRKYSSDKEKWQYGWTRGIPFKMHKQLNFNYRTKMKETVEVKNNDEIHYFTEVSEFLFTFNPSLRRNKDYIRMGVYPLDIYKDFDTVDKDGNKVRDHGEWGFCEANAMEKTMTLKTEYYCDGIFCHYEHMV